jgi:hypothetical protein
MVRGDMLKLLTVVVLVFLTIIARSFVKQFIYLPFLPKGLQGLGKLLLHLCGVRRASRVREACIKAFCSFTKVYLGIPR